MLGMLKLKINFNYDIQFYLSNSVLNTYPDYNNPSPLMFNTYSTAMQN